MSRRITVTEEEFERLLLESVGQVTTSAHDCTPLPVPDVTVEDEESHGIVAENIKLATDKELKNFLRAMLPEFLANVNPHDYGLLDLMVQDDLMCDTDRESVSGKHVNTRKDQARKVWMLLTKLPVKKFTESILPFLRKHYPHVIPKQWSSGVPDAAHTKCLQHNIMGKVRLSTFADILCETNCIPLQTYEHIISICGQKRDWTTLWDSIRIGLNELDVTEKIRCVLHKYKVPVPVDLQELVSNGIPCTCSHFENFKPPAPAPSVQTKVLQWAKQTKQWQQSGSSSSSSLGYPEVDLESVSSEATTVINVTNRKRPATDGVHDAYGSQRKQTSKNTSDETALRQWALDHKLKEETLEVLIEEGFTTLEDMNLLSEEFEFACSHKFKKLPMKQLLLVKKAVKLLSTLHTEQQVELEAPPVKKQRMQEPPPVQQKLQAANRPKQPLKPPPVQHKLQAANRPKQPLKPPQKKVQAVSGPKERKVLLESSDDEESSDDDAEIAEKLLLVWAAIMKDKKIIR